MNIEIESPDLTSYQKDILYCEARFVITEASTKAGKTFSHIWWIFERAHLSWNKRGFYHWWVAPSVSQARIAFSRMKENVRESGLYKVNDTLREITTPLGSIIAFKTSKDADALFGEDVHSVVFDEAPRAKYEAFVALRSTVTATRAPMKMIGNFGGVSNWMHQLKEKTKTDKNYAYFKVTAWDAVEAGILSREEIEQAQLDLPPKVFKALYMAEAQESDDMLCSYDSMNDLFTNQHAEKGSKYITADIALHGSDKFVVLVWDGWRIIEIITVDKCEADEVEKLLKDTATRHKVGRSNIVYDADGLGSFLRGYLRGANPFNNGAAPINRSKKSKTKVNYKNLKSQCAYLLASRINKKEIFIEAACDIELKSELLQELECLQSYDLDKDGKIQILPKDKIKEIIGRSPDYLDAFLMRMYFTVKTKAKAPKAKIYND